MLTTKKLKNIYFGLLLKSIVKRKEKKDEDFTTKNSSLDTMSNVKIR